MPTNVFIGEFEQLVLLTVLRLGDHAYALRARNELSELAERSVSRGALYKTLDRLEAKGYLAWELDDGAPSRGGHVRRRFWVTKDGVEALRASRNTLMLLWAGLDEVIG